MGMEYSATDELVSPAAVPGNLTALTRARSRRRGGFSVQEDYEAQFYKDYREVAEEYDREFLEKYDDDLNMTLIFVSSTQGLDDRTLTHYDDRLVCSQRSPLHLSLMSILNSGPTQATRSQPSFVCSSTRLITLLSEGTPPPSRNGPDLPPPWFTSKQFSSRVLLLPYSPPSWQCLASNG